MERRLRRGIASAARRGWIQRDGARTGNRHLYWRGAIAASVTAALAAGWFLYVPRHEPAALAQTNSPARHVATVASRTVLLASVRGTGDEADVLMSLSDAPGELVVQPDVVVLTCEDGSIQFECPGGVAPATPQYPEYEADLVDRGRSMLVWRSPRQAPVAGTQLSFALRDPGALEVGDYDLIVRGHSPDHEEVVARFTLRVAR